MFRRNKNYSRINNKDTSIEMISNSNELDKTIVKRTIIKDPPLYDAIPYLPEIYKPEKIIVDREPIFQMPTDFETVEIESDISSINNVIFKGSDITFTIYDDGILSSIGVAIKTIDSKDLYIWNPEYTIVNMLTKDGGSMPIGYKMIDHLNNASIVSNKKTIKNVKFCTDTVHNYIINTENSNVIFMDNVFDNKDIHITITGSNTIYLGKSSPKSFKCNNAGYSVIDDSQLSVK
jgi:hypothetical protein